MTSDDSRVSLKDIEETRAELDRVTAALEDELRHQVAAAAAQGELPISRIARAARISRPTAHAWAKKYGPNG